MTPAPAWAPVQGAPTQRLPASVVGSLGLHAALLAFLMYGAHNARKDTTHVISNVDLMIKVHKAVTLPRPVPRAPTPPSTWNFLKMALPQAPRLQQLSVPIPEHHRLMQVQPKLQDRGRIHDLPKLDALDMSKRAPSLEKLDVAEPETRHSVKALAALPKLEEVGRRQVRNLPQALKLDDERRQALQLQQMNALTTAPESHHAMAPVGAPLQEAEGAPPSSRLASKIASMLPQGGLDMRDRPMPAAAPDTFPKKAVEDQALKRRRAQALTAAPKKGVTIEGPLKNRRVLSYDIPEFPKWARDQGILEAEVAIRFWVDKDGNVLPNMRVESTSGFGQLDRLAMDSLKNWKFAPILEDGRQWGVITFRFVLE